MTLRCTECGGFARRSQASTGHEYGICPQCMRAGDIESFMEVA